MDGAVFGTYMVGRPATWQISNSPIVEELARRHGKTCNFLGCIIQRTNCTTQPEKEMAAERAVLMAKRLGARNGDAESWSGELPAIVGRYGAFHLQDYYGYGRQSRVDY